MFQLTLLEGSFDRKTGLLFFVALSQNGLKWTEWVWKKKLIVSSPHNDLCVRVYEFHTFAYQNVFLNLLSFQSCITKRCILCPRSPSFPHYLSSTCGMLHFVNHVLWSWAWEEYFSEGAKSFFQNFFPAWNAFPSRKFPFLVDPKQISVVWKVKSKKKKKKRVLSFSFHFQFSTFPFFSDFPSFLLQFPFFPFLSFPGRSAEISRSEVSGGALCPPAPRLLRHWLWSVQFALGVKI